MVFFQSFFVCLSEGTLGKLGMANPRQDFDDLTEADADVRVVLDSSPAAGYEAGT